MECYIHAGLNKAGSSFVQSVLTANATILGSAGISYLDGGRHSGNSKALSVAMRASDQPGVSRFLHHHAVRARANGASRMLLSAEYLYHDLVRTDRRNLFLTGAAAAGISAIHVLVFFRDPISHAISAYTHRAGVHNVGTFEDWIRRDYEFPVELPLFFETLETCPEIVWHPVAYGSGDSLLSALADWLGIPGLPRIPEREVNVSPSLGEAELLDRLQSRDSAAALALRQTLKAIARSDKAPEPARRARYEAAAAFALARLNPLLARLEHMVGAPLQVAVLAEAPEPACDGSLCMTLAQADAILSLVAAPPPPSGIAYEVKKIFGRHKPRQGQV